MALSKNFIGLNQFVHFYGVVEDRQDPQQTGRVRVRCLGFHTKDKLLLPTADLPWAQVLLPITSSGISGIGQTPLGLVEGSWVVGYFRDGEDAQEPIVLGSLPGKPSVGASPNPNDGFFDPAGEYPRYVDEPDCNRLAVNAQKSTDEDGDEWVKDVIVSATGTGELINVFKRVKDGTIVPEFASTVVDSAGDILDSESVTEVIDKVTGIKNKIIDGVTGKITSATGKITNAVESVKSVLSGKKINFQSLAKTAVESNPAASLILQKATQIKGVAMAIPESFTAALSGLTGGSVSGFITAFKSAASVISSGVGAISGTFDEPETGYAAQYPFNHVYESESGHIVEFDDTDGAERIQEKHKTGTGYFINPRGARAVKVMEEQFHSVGHDDTHTVGQSCYWTVKERMNLNVGKGGYQLVVDSYGDIDIQTKLGNIGIKVRGGGLTINTTGDINMECQNYNLVVKGTMTETVTGARTSTTSAPWKLTGAPISLN